MGICECKQYAAVPVESPELALAAGTTAAPRNRVARGTEAWDRAMLEAQVQPLGRELRASLDFFEHQQDRPVSQIYVTGGSARSEMILKMLHTELIVDCKAWNPTTALQLALHGQQAVEIEQIGPQLSVAIGAALAAF